MESLNELAKEIHENSVAHGWWDEKRSFGDVVALCHSELSEALEEYRNHSPMVYCIKSDCECLGDVNACMNVCGFQARVAKPEGVATEMIDCIIRILDWCGKEGIDVDGLLAAKHEYNKSRPYRHGGKAL